VSKLEDLTYSELVEVAALEIHKGFLSNEYRTQVHLWLAQAIDAARQKE